MESGSGTSMAESPVEAMRLLKQFEFPRPRWNERVSMLSGGEKRRLQLLSVLTRRPNFLILDEPTNDVDLDTLRALEGYLEEFNGVLVVVSHDRLFTDKVTNHLFVFEGNGIVKDYLGSLSDYAECLVEQENVEEVAAGSRTDTNVDGDDRKGSYKEDKEKRLERRNSIKKMKRDIDKIEPVLEKLRAKVNILQMEIDNSSDKGWTVLADLTDKLQKFNDEIEEKEMEIVYDHYCWNCILMIHYYCYFHYFHMPRQVYVGTWICHIHSYPQVPHVDHGVGYTLPLVARRYSHHQMYKLCPVQLWRVGQKTMLILILQR